MAKHNVTEKGLATHMFEQYDTMRQGRINFKQYVNILAIFKSSNREVQAKALFRMCDIDGDRRLGKLELLKFINQGMAKDQRVVVNAILDELIHLMDCESVGEITYSAFVEAVTRNDEI